MANITIKDIARASGYSIKTVSRVINKLPTVAPDIREKVESVIAKMDYQPNVWARALRSSRAHIIALFVADPTVAYTSRIQAAASAVCQQLGYHLLVEALPRSERNLAKTIKDIAGTTHLDGVLLVPPASDNLAFMKALSAAELPFVRVSPYEHLELGSYVHIDDHRIAYDMTEYLIKLGHRDIAFVKGPREHTAAAQRYRGFAAAMEKHGLAVRSDWLVPGEFDVQSGMQAGQTLFSAAQWPTAVLAANDDSAIGVMAAAYSKGAAIPGDVSIVGIDDAPIASSFWPKLTTVRQPVSDLGRVATEMLIHDIETPGDKRAELLDCEIVVRESAGLPRARGKRSSARVK